MVDIVFSLFVTLAITMTYGDNFTSHCCHLLKDEVSACAFYLVGQMWSGSYGVKLYPTQSKEIHTTDQKLPPLILTHNRSTLMHYGIVQYTTVCVGKISTNHSSRSCPGETSDRSQQKVFSHNANSKHGQVPFID